MIWHIFVEIKQILEEQGEREFLNNIGSTSMTLGNKILKLNFATLFKMFSIF